MLLYFKVRNYRSIRDEAVLDMEAACLQDSTDILLPYGKRRYLPTVAVYGKNGGGKSNLIRAMWLAAQFICNAQKTQTEKAPVPVRPFALDDYSQNEPTAFEFCYVLDGIKYVYGFSATGDRIVTEYLKTWPNKRECVIFDRIMDEFVFPENSEKKRKRLISEAVAKNQLFFAISCTMNYKPCINAMRWFREKIIFSRDYTDINKNLLEYSEDEAMLQAIVSAAKAADLGIEDMRFEINDIELDIDDPSVPQQVKGMPAALRSFNEALKQNGNEAEIDLQGGALKSTTYHNGIRRDGTQDTFELRLSDESDGTRRLMALAPAIENTIRNGGVLIVDEIERELHLVLIEYILDRYHHRNPQCAQMVFTTHETALLNRGTLRRDQIYFIDKDNDTGASDMYSLADFNVRNDMNIQKAYILGKFGAVPRVEGVN